MKPIISLKVADLPSRGLAYPDARLTYSPYSYAEVADFNESVASEADKQKMISAGIEFSEGIEKMSYNDFMYVALLRRLSSFGTSTYKVQTRCPHCSTMHTQTFTTVGFDDIQAEALPLILTLESGKELHFNVLTVENFWALDKSGELDNSSAILARCVTNVEYEEAYDLISNSTGVDSGNLFLVDKYLYHGISKVPAECKAEGCGKKFDIDLNNTKESVIYPFRESSGSNPGRIRFGNS